MFGYRLAWGPGIGACRCGDGGDQRGVARRERIGVGRAQKMAKRGARRLPWRGFAYLVYTGIHILSS